MGGYSDEESNLCLANLNSFKDVALKDTKRIFMEINVRSRSLDP